METFQSSFRSKPESNEFSLVSHPTTPCSWIQSITVTLSSNVRGLTLTYKLVGAIQCLRLPTKERIKRADNLWEHTCCEAFVAGTSATKYREWNFSPSGGWQVYEFATYRYSRTVPVVAAPNLLCTASSGQFILSADVPSEWYDDEVKLRLGLCVVLEDIAGKIYYWAVKHPPGIADFHSKKGWVEFQLE